MLADPRLNDNDESRSAKNLSSSLLDLCAAAIASLPSEKTIGFSPESASIRVFAAADERGGGQHVIEAARLAERALLSACDHARAFALLIRAEKRPSTALITVARGALEAAGRSRWLTSSLDIDAYLHRILSMLRADLRHDVDVPDALESRTTGQLVDAAERRSFYAAELNRMGLPAATRPNLSAMVRDLVAETSGLFDEKRLYSIYSGIAHGQLGALNAFVISSGGLSAPRLEAPLPVVTAATYQLIGAIRLASDQYITWLSGPDAARPHLVAAVERVAMNTRALPTVAFASDVAD
ncbi:hypothetical protein [Microbacterium gorillae]|uniref:hypothetical protein n=1 Tax=Microbacterium gorillae TaxID=1231063 RepID=UPI000590DBF7|nr:hypothetical protein [Microbacterium gorillae]